MSMRISTAQARIRWASSFPRQFVRVGSLSLWRSASCDIARATFSSLCAWCGGVRHVISLAQPSRHFARVGCSILHGICYMLACVPSILQCLRYILALQPLILHGICYMLVVKMFMWVSLTKVSLGFHLGYL